MTELIFKYIFSEGIIKMSINSLFFPNSYDLYCDELTCNTFNASSVGPINVTGAINATSVNATGAISCSTLDVADSAIVSGQFACDFLTVENQPLLLSNNPVPNLSSYTYDAPVSWSADVAQLVRGGDPVTCTLNFKKIGITGSGNSIICLEIGPAYALFGDTNLSATNGLVVIDLTGVDSAWLPAAVSPNNDFSFASALHNNSGISQTTTTMGSFYYNAVDKTFQIGQNGVQVFSFPSSADQASGSNYRFYCSYFI